MAGMGMPSINITFIRRAQTLSRRSEQRSVAIIVKDAATTIQGLHILADADDIPSALGVDNKAYVERAFVGGERPPSRVLLYVLPEDAEDYTDALTALETQLFDWLVVPPDVTDTLALEVALWVRDQRDKQDAVCKAVLPDVVADDEAVVNFITTNITVGERAYSNAEYCSRIAGLIAGTPLTESGTYKPLLEASGTERLTRVEMDEAVDAGKLLIYHDSVKVKMGRAVTSLTTTNEKKSPEQKKIKIVEIMDLIKFDLRLLFQDEYVGRFPNSYDNKCVLITAVQGYFSQLETEGILQSGMSTVEIDMAAQREYLRKQGEDVAKMTEKEIREADTGSHVFLKASIRILDAMEDIALVITY